MTRGTEIHPLACTHNFPVKHIVLTISLSSTLYSQFPCQAHCTHNFPVKHIVLTISLSSTLYSQFPCQAHCTHNFPVKHIVLTISLSSTLYSQFPCQAHCTAPGRTPRAAGGRARGRRCSRPPWPTG